MHLTVHQMGEIALLIVSLGLIIFPVLVLAFPKEVDTAIKPHEFWQHTRSFRDLLGSDRTAAMLSQLHLPDSWLQYQATTAYLKVEALGVILAFVIEHFFTINILVLVLVLLVLSLSVSPLLASKMTASALKSQYKKQRAVYSTSVIHAMILVAAQIRGTTTIENAIGNLGANMPSSAVNRFSQDVSDREAGSGGKRLTTGEAVAKTGEDWDIPMLKLIGSLLDSGLSLSDVAEQITSQVEMGYVNELTAESTFYEGRSSLMMSVVMLSLFAVVVVGAIPILSGIVSKI
jgi:multisubunit Na+/H+ antiporter MnhG subunit